MKIFLIVFLLVGGDAAEWQKTLTEIVQTKDKAKALERIAVLEKELQQAGTPEEQARLGELIVRAKLPRLGMMQQGMEAVRAIGIFERVLKTQPKNAEVLYLHARTSLSMPEMFGKRDAGVRSLETLVGLADAKPGAVAQPDAFLVLARLKPDTAAKTLRIGLRSFPEDKRAAAKAAKAGLPAVAIEGVAAGSKPRFLAALLANKLEYAKLDRDLAAGQAAQPSDYEYPLYRGLLRLWQLESVPGARGASEGITLFRKALEINPKDTRIYGWLGSLLYAAGHATGQKQIVAEGERVLAEGVEKNPEQNLFGRAIAYRITGTHPERIEDDLYRTMELASGKKMDRARFLPGAVTRDHPSLKDSKYAPFNLSGTLYWAGEYFRSMGDKQRARDAFEAALEADATKQWPYRKLAIERLALLAGKQLPVTKNPTSCMLCHQK